ncbi:MAG: phage tail tip lysozyme, partial [Streptococcus salivarius]
MKRIGDKAARVLLTIFGVKTTIIIGTILTFAVILIAIITGLMGTISTSGGKGSKTNAQCVTYQKDGDEEDDDEEDDDDGSKPQSTSTKTDSASAGDSDPFTKGTKAYENAHKVFMAFVNAGLSGESAAGAVGWANSEGSYDIIGRAQGHYGGGINDSISKGAVPTTGGTSNTLGGGGIFQFDPYTKYAPLNSPDWEDADKMVAFVIDAISKGDWNPAYDESGHNWSFQEFAKQTNIDETAMSWNAYERGNMAYVKPDQKKADARKFAEVFEASKYKYDDAKFQKAFGGGGASSNNSSSSSQSSDDDDGDDDEEDSDNEDDDNDSSSSSSSSDSSNKASKKDSDKDKKTIDTDKAIKWYKDKLGKVKYSRDARTGPDSYDHSSALYYALVDGGAKESGSPVDTDSEHDWLKDNGYELVYEGAWSSKDDVQNREKGDVIIWGTKGSSSGDKGQTMLVEDKENIIQCSPSTDGIAENNYGQYRDRITMDYEKVYVYRPK